MKIINEKMNNRLIMGDGESSSPTSLPFLQLLQHQRRYHQQMIMMKMIMRKNGLRHARHQRLHPERPSHFYDHSIVTPNCDSVVVPATEKVEEMKNSIPTMIMLPTKAKSSLSTKSSTTPSRKGVKRDRNDDIDEDAATITTNITSTSSSFNEDIDHDSLSNTCNDKDMDDDAFNDDVDNESLTSEEKGMIFFRHAQRELCQSNTTFNEIGARIIKHESTCVQEALLRMKKEKYYAADVEIKVSDQSLSLLSDNTNGITQVHRCKKRKIQNNNHNVDRQTVPDVIQSCDDDDEVSKLKDNEHSKSFCHHRNNNNNNRMLLSLLHKQHQQQQLQLKQIQDQIMLYKRACRMKRMSMLFRQMNTYQRTLYSEIQSYIHDEK